MRLRLLAALLGSAALSCCTPLHRGAGEAPSPLPVATGDYPAHGHAPDFSWMSGTVERDLTCVYLDFGDRRRSPWGGRIALDATADQSASLREGDSVVIKGELSAFAYAGCGDRSYRVASIEEH